ncbi:hypothetical protein FHS51_003450 [Sphingobium wenxiniae]|uniref:Uncharacterized protein n=1 Tax=Sphingobium wenxiniae (strain DSM 21828 / CGMCC 1.7748 / JZ-1) TaxID=595605 RepID=A0A562KN28_SPHWJ|nr:DUF6511 domain-containing protein [Sphingobium wenxiniae]MBB6193194.1 hypothetical protein [Sphingobium wenxiniae]TWH96747.1 hypothetical protein IQ35_00678 [Sphingobium wenxiniae]
MDNPGDRERAALIAAMKSMGSAMAGIGWHRRFNELTDQQAAALAEAAVDGFQRSMWESAPEVPF